jgi:hypothetical protein
MQIGLDNGLLSALSGATRLQQSQAVAEARPHPGAEAKKNALVRAKASQLATTPDPAQNFSDRDRAAQRGFSRDLPRGSVVDLLV